MLNPKNYMCVYNITCGLFVETIAKLLWNFVLYPPKNCNSPLINSLSPHHKQVWSRCGRRHQSMPIVWCLRAGKWREAEGKSNERTGRKLGVRGPPVCNDGNKRMKQIARDKKLVSFCELVHPWKLMSVKSPRPGLSHLPLYPWIRLSSRGPSHPDYLPRTE